MRCISWVELIFHISQTRSKHNYKCINYGLHNLYICNYVYCLFVKYERTEYTRKNNCPIMIKIYVGKQLISKKVTMCEIWCQFKVAATSLKLEIRLHAYPVGTNTRSGTEVILHSSDWLMRSELGYTFHESYFRLKRRCIDFKSTSSLHLSVVHCGFPMLVVYPMFFTAHSFIRTYTRNCLKTDWPEEALELRMISQEM